MRPRELQMQGLGHVLWIGGSPGAGKSSVACRIARSYGLRWYSSDTRTWQHRDHALLAGNHGARRWESMTPEQRWTESSPREMLEMSLHRERGPMVIDDVRALPASPLIVAEGSVLPAAAVSSGVADPSRSVWLIATPEFQRATLTARGIQHGPMGLYLLLGEVIEQEAVEQGVPVLRVDGSGPLAETVAAVEAMFAAALADGPRASTSDERHSLLREANHALAAQVRDLYARPWAAGDAETVVQAFLCECGDPGCDATVAAQVGALSAGPVLAEGHYQG